ncbi:uncharacterized protein LOC119727769 [Patiria miniata]|uniref:Uncharacterized protein n=1 Tax=Patiria miniata TaxID=46514 RepID=A0A913ZW56_PATMI|nr:uncharacterized protein LOC119727769 [Patiria miniata]
MSQQHLLLMLIGFLVGVTSNHVPHRSPTVNRDCPQGCVCHQDYIVDCGYAGLETIPHVPPKTRKLILDGNSITDIRGEDISRMTDLEELYLHGNKIQSITDGTFWQLLRLRLLDLSHNPLQCDCNLKSEFEILNSMKATLSLRILNLEGTTCSFPMQVGGKAIRVINSGAMECQQREKRRARHGGFCDRDPCQNGGTCYESVRMSGRCDCPTGFCGEFCEWLKGDKLSLRVSEVSGYYITVQWRIDIDVMDFRIKSVEDPTGTSPIEDQEWVDGSCTMHKLSDLHPSTMYEICVAAYGFGMYGGAYAKSPGNLLEEVCLLQKTDPVPTTTENSPDSKTPQRPTSSLGSEGGQDQTKIVMTIFGVILSVCVVLILAVLALYLSRRRGITLLPRRRRRRRRTPPNIVQADNPTYGSTGSPTPSVHDLPIEEGERPAQENDIPLILVTSASNEDIVNPNGAGCDGTSMSSETEFIESCADPSEASAHDQTCSADEAKELPQREDGDGDSSHEEDFENGHLDEDKNEPDRPERPEKEVIQC